MMKLKAAAALAGLVGCVVATAAPHAVHAADPIYQTDFSDGVPEWTAVHHAEVSDLSRRPGGKSLVIRQTKDDEADSAWLSPPLKNPGQPVRVSLWAADNYYSGRDIVDL